MKLWIPAAYLSSLLQCMALTFLWVYGDTQLVTLQQMKFLKENPALSGGGTAPNEPTCRKQRTRVSNEMLFFAPTIERGTQLTVPGRFSSARNGTGGSSKEDPRFRRHRNHHSCRSKRTAYRQLAPRSLSTSSPSPSSSSQALPSFSLPISTSSSSSSLSPPSSSSLVSAKKGEKTGEESQPSANTSGTPSDTHDAVFLGSIHMDSYQRIINASISNPGSTSSPGRVSATDPYIDPATPTHVTGYTGVTAILSCFVNNLGQRSGDHSLLPNEGGYQMKEFKRVVVSWVRNRDIHVLTVGRFTFTNDDRFFSHHDDGSNEWALRLRSPKTEDSGYYECQVNTKPILKRLIFLQVLEPHAVVYGVQELYVKLGSTVELKCSVINAPSKPDFLLWYHDEKVMNYEKGRVIINISEEENDTGSILRITSATGKDSGTYTCSPSNAKNASVNLHIINGEHPAAMQTNCGKIVVCHFGFLTLALFIGPCLMIKMPDIAILMIFRQKVTQKGS